MATFYVLILFCRVVLTKMVQEHNLLGVFKSFIFFPNFKVKAISESSSTTKFHNINGIPNDIIVDASTLLIIRFICDRSLIVVPV